MILLQNVNLPLDTDFADPAGCLRRAGVRLPQGARAALYRRSVDARKKDAVHFNCAFTVECREESLLCKQAKKYAARPFAPPVYQIPRLAEREIRPLVCGFGPAGMFAALVLARAGLCPVVLERGRPADRRKRDVDAFFGGAPLDPVSNVQFGEGGAGTFSDGKLHTGIRDPRIRTVLEVFASHGADPRILTDAKPHIGTDRLIGIVQSIRREIETLGGTVLFEHRLAGIETENGALCGVTVQTPAGERRLPCTDLILAPGQSARDTYGMLLRRGVALEPKPFAIGARIEHLQSAIDKTQYGAFAGHPALGAADYKLACHLPDGRGVFTFCMCPGGEVLNAASERGGVLTNGMSNAARNGRNANAALLASVSPAEFYRGDPLDGIAFRKEIENRACEAGGGLPVCQRVGDFLAGTPSGGAGAVLPTARPGVSFGAADACLPPFITAALRTALPQLDRLLPGFAAPEALLTGPETRSSSPVRILRDESGCATFRGLYPCGEGAGYAGGITSAAVDGMKAAESLISACLREAAPRFIL